MKKYKVTLTADERNFLQELIAAGKAAAKKLTHARILLKADAAPGGPDWTDARIAEALEVNVTTVERLRERFVEQGLDAALARKKQDRPSRERKLDGKAEARLIALDLLRPAPRTSPLDVAAFGGQVGRARGRGHRVHRDRTPGAKKTNSSHG